MNKNMLKTAKRFHGIKSFFFGGENNTGRTIEGGKKIIPLAIGLLIYGLVLWITKTGYPDFWDAWHSPTDFFYATNAAVLVCILSIALMDRKLWGVIGLIVIGIFLIPYCRDKVKEEAKKARDLTRRTEVAQDSTKNGIQNSSVLIRSSRLFKFEEGGSIRLYLRQGWASYPKGGKIEISTPSGKIWPDEPGIDRNMGFQPDGWYTFTKVDENATGVEIYGYW